MKHKRGGESVLYTTPTVLVGATGNGKPNFITIAHNGIMTHSHVSLGMSKYAGSRGPGIDSPSKGLWFNSHRHVAEHREI